MTESVRTGSRWARSYVVRGAHGTTVLLANGAAYIRMRDALAAGIEPPTSDALTKGIVARVGTNGDPFHVLETKPPSAAVVDLRGLSRTELIVDTSPGKVAGSLAHALQLPGRRGPAPARRLAHGRRISPARSVRRGRSYRLLVLPRSCARGGGERASVLRPRPRPPRRSPRRRPRPGSETRRRDPSRGRPHAELRLPIHDDDLARAERAGRRHGKPGAPVLVVGGARPSVGPLAGKRLLERAESVDRKTSRSRSAVHPARRAPEDRVAPGHAFAVRSSDATGER